MNAERTLQQVVNPFTDIHVKSRVAILQHDFFLKVMALFGSALQEKKDQDFFWNISENGKKKKKRLTIS